MFKSLISILILAALAICVGAIVVKTQVFKHVKLRRTLTSGDKMFVKIASVIAGVFGLLLLAVPASIHTVEAGTVAVVKVLGEAKYIRTAGTYFDFWVTNNYIYYDATVQNLDIKTTAYSKDAQTMDINMTVQYKINPEQSIDIATKYGSLETLSNRIESVSIERSKSHLSSFSAMEIIENRSSISPAVEALIQETISDQYYVTIVASVVTNIDFSDAFETTVENKMIAEQEVLTAQYEKEKAIIAAEQALEVAKLQAQAVLAEAQAEADAKEMIAQAEAKAISYKSVEVARMLGFNIIETSTEEGVVYEIDFTGKTDAEIRVISDYLKYVEYLSSWNGELPDTVVTDSSGASLLIPSNPLS